MNFIDDRREPAKVSEINALRYSLEEYSFSVYVDLMNKLADEELKADNLSKEENRFAMMRINSKRKQLLIDVTDYNLKLQKHEADYLGFHIPEFNFPKFKHT